MKTIPSVQPKSRKTLIVGTAIAVVVIVTIFAIVTSGVLFHNNNQPSTPSTPIPPSQQNNVHLYLVNHNVSSNSTFCLWNDEENGSQYVNGSFGNVEHVWNIPTDTEYSWTYPLDGSIAIHSSSCLIEYLVLNSGFKLVSDNLPFIIGPGGIININFNFITPSTAFTGNLTFTFTAEYAE